MRDVVKMVLQAEDESKRILEDAEARAERIVADARRKAQDMVQTRRRETVEQGEALVVAADGDAQREKKERLAQAATEIEAAVHLDEQAAQNAIEAVLRCVCGSQ